jgi:hypothetical protein
MSKETEGRVTDEDILRVLKDSGYPLEQEIASCLEKMEWSFTLNYAFTDIETNISREIDILAERKLRLENISEPVGLGTTTGRLQKWKGIEQRVRLNIELLVECKKIKSSLVFFCRPKQSSDYFPSNADDIIQHSGTKPEIVVKPLNELSHTVFTVGQFLKFGKLSHYSRSKEKATQFCKIYRSGKNLAADHAEVYQSFVVPLIKAVEYQKMVRQAKPSQLYFDMFLHYPIIVIDGMILKTDPECKLLEKTHHVEFVRNYYSSKIGGTYRIDVVEKSYLCEFIEKVLTPSILSIEKEIGKNEKAIANGGMRVRSVASLLNSIMHSEPRSPRQLMNCLT